ncbi:MAG: DUF5655 domain-containing protein [Spirochaetota bacterium]|nr:DUF5655 domain-containing protein [Spirochaetota bacterium]
MKHIIIKNNKKYLKHEYSQEEELTNLFSKNFQNIISDKSLFIKIEKQVKSKNFKNFKHSISDGFLLVWENPTTPSLYITEIELEKHDINKHILPQLGNFISFIQSASIDELNVVRNFLYEEIKNNKQIFNKIQKDTGKEVHKLLDDSMEDLQILLVIDRITPELSIGLLQIEKAINVKIRKIEVSLFIKNREEVILFSDSEITEDEMQTSKERTEFEYTLEYHFENKPEKILSIFNSFLEHVKTKNIKISPMKHYIGFFKNNNMIFSCVVRKNSLVYYSKANINEIKSGNFNIPFRDVSSIGHYTNHLPTEIVITESDQIDDLIKYFNEVYKKY